MALDVKVKIDLTKPAGKVGFGIPLILEENAETAIEYTECTSLSDVATAGFAATNKAYKAANLIFMQANAPKTIAVCATTGSTQTWLSSIDNTSKSWRQLIVVNGSSTATSVSGIMSAIEPLDGKIYFASLPVDDSTGLTVSNINRTVLFYCSAQNDEIISGKYTMASGTYTDDNYAGEQLVTGSKYILNVDGKVTTVTATTAEDYAQITDGTVTVKTKTGELTVSGVGTDTYNISILNYFSGFESAALVGATAGKNPGSITYKNQILKGINPQSLTDSQITAIHKKGGLTFVTKAGDNVTTEGKVAGGEYIDIIDSQDYVIQQLEYGTQKALNTAGRIPYDNTGIALLESVAVDVFQDAYINGIIATNDDGTPAYSVSYAPRTETTATDRAARRYLGGQFSFTLSGAIHECEITGSIIV